MCVNAATIVAGYPAAAAICLTGDGKIILALGLGVPSGEYIIGQTTAGGPASEVLLGGSFAASVGEANMIVGKMQSIPSGDTANYSGFGVSASPVGQSLTYGIELGNVNTGIAPPTGFDPHEGGG